MEYRIIIAGSRGFDDYALLEKTLDEYIGTLPPQETVCIISGGAKGADRLGERYAEQHFLPLIRREAAWQRYGRAAGPIRNEVMAATATEAGCHGILVAFWDGHSRGTENMINQARRRGMEVRVCNFSPETD